MSNDSMYQVIKFEAWDATGATRERSKANLENVVCCIDCLLAMAISVKMS